MQYLKQKEGNFLETLSSSVEESLRAEMASRSARSLSVVGSAPGSINRAMAAAAGGGGRVVKQREEGSPRCYNSLQKYYLSIYQSIFYTTVGCWCGGCPYLPSLNEDFVPILDTG